MEVTEFQDSTLYWLTAAALHHLSSYGPFLHSLPIAHNLYIRRRELSLLLIAILKLQPLLTLGHYSHAHRPSTAIMFMLMLATIAQIHTQDSTFIQEHQSFNMWQTTFTLKDDCTFINHLLNELKFQVLRVRITRLSISLLLMPPLAWHCLIAVGLNRWELDFLAYCSILRLLQDSTKWK